MTDFFDHAYRALDQAGKAGADEAEIFCVKDRSITIDVQRDAIDLAKESLISGIGIRAIVNGAVGFSSTNDPVRVEEAAVLAVKSARVRKSDPQWSGLPEKSHPARVSGIFDRRIADLEIEPCIDYTTRLINGALSIPSVMPTSGHFFCGTSTHLILNSRGVEIKDSHTIILASVDTITRTSPAATASEFDISRGLDIDFFKTGERASLICSKSQNGTHAQTGDTTVLLEPPAFADIIENAFFASINADNVQKGRSSLIGKLESKIAADELSLIDDGTLSGGMGTASSDDEGMPSQKVAVVEKGILSSFLYDCYTAGKEQKESTSNGVRHSFTTTPSVGVRNLIVDHPTFDVVAETEKGLIVNTVIGAHTANPISGDFSVEGRNSFLIENGEISSPIRSVMLSGNIFEVLQNIDGIGKDVRKVGNVITPTVRISKMRVIGD